MEYYFEKGWDKRGTPTGTKKKYQLFWKRSPSPVFPPSGLGSASMYNRLETCGNHRGVLAPKKVDTATKLQKTNQKQREYYFEKGRGFFYGDILILYL